MIVGLSGKKRVGKSTVGAYLRVKYGFVEIAFADLLKDIAKKIGWNGAKDERGRRLLQDLGMVVRNYNRDYWVDAAFKLLEKYERQGYEHFVITDVRFMNEIAKIRTSGGLLYRLNGNTAETGDTHASEVELDTFEHWDGVIESVRGDFNSLYKQVDALMEKARAKKEKEQTAEQAA